LKCLRVLVHPPSSATFRLNEDQLGKGEPKLFTPWMALQDQELAQED
jgi:hypothetical protein